MPSRQVPAYFALGLEIMALLIFVAFFSVLARAIKTGKPESWRGVRSWIPMLIVMMFGIAFGFWSPHFSPAPFSN